MSERVLTLDMEGADLPGAGDPCITDIIPAALAAIDPSLPGACQQAASSLGVEAGARQVLLILVDGFGYELMMDHMGHTPTLRRLRSDIRSIHTIVPSTTSAAITAFGTGARPGATNMVGFSVAYGSGVMNLLAMEGGPAPTEWQPADTLEQRVNAALRELRAGTPVVYLYWSEIDHCGHSHGVASDAWIGQIEQFDAGLSMLLRGLPRGVRAVLTADHGMINVDPAAIVDVASTPALRDGVRIVAGETRAAHVHAQEGRAEEVAARWRETLGESAWVLTRDQMPALIGPGDGAATIGDLLVLSRGRAGVVDSRTQSASAIAMPGIHGSVTPTEMRIPVITLA